MHIIILRIREYGRGIKIDKREEVLGDEQEQKKVFFFL